MKVFQSVLISFVAGLCGAFVFTYYYQPDLVRSEAEPINMNNFTAAPIEQASSVDHANIGVGSVDFSNAAAKALPSVVYIKCISQGVESYSYWDLLFGGGGRQTRVSSGSGVIFSSDGYIVTNNHVIESGETIQVQFDKQSYEAELIGTDPSTDLAVLKIDRKDLPAITLGNSKELAVGEWVIAVGNPFSLSSTVTAGIVSAKGRRLNIVKDRFPIESFIQTDAAINPGNSGGALVDKEGKLVGINTAILSETGSYTGYAFAVPVDITKKVVQDLIQYGILQKAIFGGTIVDNNFQIAETLDQHTSQYVGVILMEMESGGAADQAGLKVGDIITAIDGVPINSESAFEEELSYRSPGDNIQINIVRKEKPKTISLTLLNRNGEASLLTRKVYSDATLGATFEAVDYGVKVYKIKDGIFARLGLNENFIITSINRQRVQEPQEVIDFFHSYHGPCILRGINNTKREVSYRFSLR